MKPVSKILIPLVFFSFLFASCYSSAEKVDNAEADVAEAEADLVAANKAYEEDMANYRRETALRIAANEKSMLDFKARIANDKLEARQEYLKKIALLEQKNTDMKKRLDDYKADGKDNWNRFKEEFNNDMEGLGQALKDLTSENN